MDFFESSTLSQAFICALAVERSPFHNPKSNHRLPPHAINLNDGALSIKTRPFDGRMPSLAPPLHRLAQYYPFRTRDHPNHTSPTHTSPNPRVLLSRAFPPPSSFPTPYLYLPTHRRPQYLITPDPPLDSLITPRSTALIPPEYSYPWLPSTISPIPLHSPHRRTHHDYVPRPKQTCCTIRYWSSCLSCLSNRLTLSKRKRETSKRQKETVTTSRVGPEQVSYVDCSSAQIANLQSVRNISGACVPGQPLTGTFTRLQTDRACSVQSNTQGSFRWDHTSTSHSYLVRCIPQLVMEIMTTLTALSSPLTQP